MRWIGLEPDRRRRADLAETAVRYGHRDAVLPGRAEDLPLPADSVRLDHGCDPSRRIDSVLERAGFDRLELRRFRSDGRFLQPFIAGYAQIWLFCWRSQEVRPVTARRLFRSHDCSGGEWAALGLRPGYLRRAMEAGARGFLVKDGPVDALAQTIRRVHAGQTVVDPDLATAALSAGANPLTEREQDVLVAASEGATVAVISRTLHLSDSTVRNYPTSAIGKTGSRNRMEAVHTARSNGWL